MVNRVIEGDCAFLCNSIFSGLLSNDMWDFRAKRFSAVDFSRSAIRPGGEKVSVWGIARGGDREFGFLLCRVFSNFLRM